MSVFTETEKAILLQEAADRMREYTFPFLTPIVAASSSQVGDHIGTGFFCELGGRKTLVTASHVISNALKIDDTEPFQGTTTEDVERVIAISIGGGQGDRHPMVALLGSRVRAPHIKKPTSNPLNWLKDADRDLDISVDFLPESIPGLRDQPFWPEYRISREDEPHPRDCLFLHGYPALRSVNRTLYYGSDHMNFHTLPYAGVRRPEDAIIDGLKPFEFAFQFDYEDAFGVETGDRQLFERDDTGASGARGLSGSPVWRMGINKVRWSEWDPGRHAELVGVVTMHVPSAKLLIATHAHQLIALAQIHQNEHRESV